MTILQAESATAICQRALTLAEHRNTFDSLEDGSTLAREARLRYDIRRRQILEALDWNFARRRKAGQAVQVDATPDLYPAAWARPEDCIRIRGIWSGGVLLTHVVEEVIFTKAVDAVQLVFTAEKSDPVFFPPCFTAALEYLLAADFSMSYSRSVNRQEIMLGRFRDAMIEADAMEAGERSETEAYGNGGWVEAVISPYGSSANETAF
jgi:hypothetical protein